MRKRKVPPYNSVHKLSILSLSMVVCDDEIDVRCSY